MSKTGLNFSKLISFNRLLDNSKKEKSINKSVSESSMLSDNDKDTKLNTLFKKFKKDKINRHQEGNNIHEKVNKDQKEANIQKSPNGSNNIQSTGENYQELIKLVPECSCTGIFRIQRDNPEQRIGMSVLLWW
jgi:hypothetical protein